MTKKIDLGCHLLDEPAFLTMRKVRIAQLECLISSRADVLYLKWGNTNIHFYWTNLFNGGFIAWYENHARISQNILVKFFLVYIVLTASYEVLLCWTSVAEKVIKHLENSLVSFSALGCLIRTFSFFHCNLLSPVSCEGKSATSCNIMYNLNVPCSIE